MSFLIIKVILVRLVPKYSYLDPILLPLGEILQYEKYHAIV